MFVSVVVDTYTKYANGRDALLALCLVAFLGEHGPIEIWRVFSRLEVFVRRPLFIVIHMFLS